VIIPNRKPEEKVHSVARASASLPAGDVSVSEHRSVETSLPLYHRFGVHRGGYYFVRPVPGSDHPVLRVVRRVCLQTACNNPTHANTRQHVYMRVCVWQMRAF